uniref:Uncharacterized protein n=1 Tax=Phytophthora ramorum TaxID=164328 RepID=H3GJZ5_PHYRM
MAEQSVAEQSVAKRVESATPLSTVKKLKLQLFHRLQRRHRDAWKRYWGAFQLYLAAKLSIEEFHALAEELLGPDKLDLHNKFVVALLSTAYQEEGDSAELRRNPQPPPAPEIQGHNGEGGGEAVRAAAGSSAKDPLLQIIKEEGARHADGDSEQRSSVMHGSREVHGRKRPHSSVAPADNNAEEADRHSAQLLMGLGKHATTISPSSIAITPGSAPSSSRGFEASVSSDGRRD